MSIKLLFLSNVAVKSYTWPMRLLWQATLGLIRRIKRFCKISIGPAWGGMWGPSDSLVMLANWWVSQIKINLWYQSSQYQHFQNLSPKWSLTVWDCCARPKQGINICDCICEKGSYTRIYKYLEIQIWNIKLIISGEGIKLLTCISPRICSHTRSFSWSTAEWIVSWIARHFR